MQPQPLTHSIFSKENMKFTPPQSELIRLSPECWQALIRHAERTKADSPRAALEPLILQALSDVEDVERSIDKTAKLLSLRKTLNTAKSNLQNYQYVIIYNQLEKP